MTTALYSALHFGVDLICAWAMFGKFIPGTDGYAGILLYNFCAFALQMPLGALLDLFRSKGSSIPKYAAAAGVLITILGAFTHPIILGSGNALFHVGGGICAIEEDHAQNWRGRGLGVFVAPGALGLYLGRFLSGSILPVVFVMTVLTVITFFTKNRPHSTIETKSTHLPIQLVICCFIVVILRSHVGIAAQMPWNTTFFLSTASVIAVVFGKIAGGFLSAGISVKSTIIASLALSAVCFINSSIPALGLIALFCFNMTMPITLYLLIQKFRGYPGFSFGLLTFGLFLGFLPTYFEFPKLLHASMLGAAGSLISMLLLLIAIRKEPSES